ncbi:MAG: c-type cytochrome [Chloroflexi bacterium]|nr:c-type cytochrome [Chloroflexota bacterium]
MLPLSGCAAAPTDPTPSKRSVKATEAPPAADESVGGDPAEGHRLFLAKGCIACHQVRGIPEATGVLGPALTGVASRKMIAGSIPNTPQSLRAWIMSPQRLKSDTMMPNLGLTEPEATNLVALLETLK